MGKGKQKFLQMNDKKKVLIGYATAGIGHKKASFAIKEALEAKRKDVDIACVDVITYTNAFFRRTYCPIYLLLINRLILLWGFFYFFFDIRIVHFLFYPLRRAIHIVNSRPLIKFMLEERPDVVVSTHFLLPDVCSYLKRKYKMKIHVIGVITDYKAHSFWVSGGIDTYIAGHERVAKELIDKWSIPQERIKVLGIPVEPRFSSAYDRAAIREKMHLSADSFVLLFLSGGYGVGPVMKLIQALNKPDLPLAAINVCGHNKKLYDTAEYFRKKAHIQVINLGFVDNVDELMAVSDVGIGKAGGISTTESLSRELPFIFVRPIPGQEKANADLFVKTGAGIRLRKIRDILTVVERLRTSPEKLRAMRENIGRMKKPEAARDCADFIIERLKTSG